MHNHKINESRKNLFAILAISFGLLLQAKAQNTLTNGLEAYYLFDGDVTDSSGNGNNGTNVGATFTTDRFGNNSAAISFSNPSEVTTSFFPPLGGGSRTFSGWFNVGTPSSQMTMLAYGDPNSAARFELKITSIGQFALDISQGTLWTTQSYDDSTWHNFIVVVQSNSVLSSVLFYLDGMAQTSLNSDAPTKTLNTIGTYPLMFGEIFLLGDTRQLTGDLDDVRVYDRALSGAEVAELYVLESGQSNLPPIITQQPLSLTITNEAQASFTVSAYSLTSLGYQWQENGTNLVDGGEFSGSTTTNLVVAPASFNDIVNYTVIVTNALGSATSSVATLTIATNLPAITSQPQSLTVTNQGRASFSVTASNLYSLTYQWQKNGTNLMDGGEVSGSTTTNLILFPASTNDAAGYTVIVTNLFGSATSSVATLTIIDQSALTNGLLAYYPFNGYANDASGNGNNGTNFGATFVPDRFGLAREAIYFTNNYVGTGFYPPLGTAARTFSGWFYAAPSASQMTLLDYGNPNVTEQIALKINPGGQFDLDISGYGLSSAGTYNDENWHSFVVIIPASSTLAGVIVYLDDVLQTNLVVPVPGAPINTVTSHPLLFGQYFNAGNPLPLTGALDDVRVYNRALSDAEVQLLYSFETTAPDAAPLIVQQPHSVTLTNGSSANFNVAVSGLAPFAYQWQLGGTNLANGNGISGSTTSNLTLNPATLGLSGTFDVIATNAYGSVTSSVATLTVRTIFAWRVIASPQLINLPVSVSLLAENITNGIVTNFTGSVGLSASGGVAITPTNASAFVNGVWSGKIKVPIAYTNLVLTATDSLGDVASANPFNVVAPPQLGVDTSGDIALLLWPIVAPNTVVQTSTNLSRTNWIPISTQPVQIGNQLVLPMDMSDPHRFYRLRFSEP